MGLYMLTSLKVGDNVSYTCERILQEMLQCASSQIQEPIHQAIRESTYYNILLDETTDISILNQLTIMARYMDSDNVVKTAFLGLVGIPDGKDVTVHSATVRFLEDHSIPTTHLIGLGSDGAAVMAGKKGGGSALNWSIYTVLHIDLASAHAANDIPSLKNFKSTMQLLFQF